MGSDSKILEDDAIRLPHQARAKLALRLIESLDPGEAESADELWLAESEQRLHRYDAGASSARDADVALSEIEKQLE